MQKIEFEKTVNGMHFKIQIKKHTDGTTTIIIDNDDNGVLSKNLYQLSETEKNDLIKFLQGS